MSCREVANRVCVCEDMCVRVCEDMCVRVCVGVNGWEEGADKRGQQEEDAAL